MDDEKMDNNVWDDDDLLSPESFTELEPKSQELFVVRLPTSRDKIVNLIQWYVRWCNKYVNYLSDVYCGQEGNQYFISGVIRNSSGESIHKREIEELAIKYQETYSKEEIEDLETDLFGYVEVLNVEFYHFSPIEVRVVCCMEKMISFWGVLIKSFREAYYLDYLKPEIWNLGTELPAQLDKNQITTPLQSLLSFSEVHKVARGRKSDVSYDIAYERIKNGMTPHQAYELYLSDERIQHDKYSRDAFFMAMKRRHNKA